MSWVLTVVGFAVLIVLHELGHFAVAKAVGMRVERFSLGLGPLVVKVRRGETDYGLAPIPLGGYVKIFGMNPYELEPRDGEEESQPALSEQERARAFFHQPVWKRIAVIAAGPAVNIVLAFVILWVVFATSAQVPVKGPSGRPVVEVSQVQAGAPAAGVLRPGDRVLAADGRRVDESSLRTVIASHRCRQTPPTAGCAGRSPVVLTVLRDGHRLTLAATPRYDPGARTSRLGFGYEPALARAGVGQAASSAVSQIGDVTSTTVSRVAQIFTSAKARRQLNSVVGASDVVHQAFSFSTAAAFFILAIISLSLAIINLFPFLPLDGGHIFWALAEKVRGRAVPFAVMERASVIGFGLVLVVFAIGLTNDVHTLTNGGFHVR